MLTLLAKILSALNSDASPMQISLAVGLAMFAGFNPWLSVMGLLTLVLLFSLRANLSTFIALTAVFSGVALLIAQPMAAIGDVILTHPELQSVFTELYQTYWFRLAHLNNTLVMGAMVSSLVLFLPLLFLSRFLVLKYRQAFQVFVEKFKVVQSLKASKFYSIYQSVSGA